MRVQVKINKWGHLEAVDYVGASAYIQDRQRIALFWLEVTMPDTARLEAQIEADNGWETEVTVDDDYWHALVDQSKILAD